MGNEASINLNEMFDKKQNEIADAPEYITPLNSYLKVLIKECKRDKVNDKDVVKFVYEVREVLECKEQPSKDYDGVVPVPGNLMSETFFLTSQESMSYLKRHVAKIWENFPGTSIGELLQQLAGQEVYISTKRRSWVDKETKEKKFNFSTLGLQTG